MVIKSMNFIGLHKDFNLDKTPKGNHNPRNNTQKLTMH